MKVIVIGGGPAGMMAAISAAKNNHKVILIEKNKQLGKKFLITGKGRCNVTSSVSMNEFIKNTPRNGTFLYEAYNIFTNQDIINFLKEEGLAVKEERGNRIFPVTDKSIDVLKCFERQLKKHNVEIYFESKVIEILTENNKIKGIKIEKNNEQKTLNADKVILATGGKSYPLTGSTGDGYKLSEKIGHKITDIRPSLVPLVIYEKDTCQKLQGLSLRNIAIKIKNLENKKCIYQDFGEMLFTHFGVSGPIILSSSSILTRYKNIEELLKNKKIILNIDLKPALDEIKLEKRILRDWNVVKNKEFKNSLNELLPQKLINIIIELSPINPNKKVNEITKKERKKLVNILKNLNFTVQDLGLIEEAIITSGGINIKEINPKTMESKIIKNLYFAGEIIDVDSFTGGFNLQIAYSTGFVAGLLQ